MSSHFHKIFQGHDEMSVRYDAKQEAIWTYFKPSGRPCFSPALLKESKSIQKSIIGYFQNGGKKPYPVRYIVMASQTPGVFNLGGDLNLFIKLIAEQRRDLLLEYATACIDICYPNSVALDLPITTITLVEGSALGGGMESAMSSNVLIAEEHAQMGVPEIRFNLFPGMGAYSFIARKVGAKTAQEMLQKGEVYSAREMYNLKIVDVLADKGKGYEAVDEYIRKHKRIANGMRAIEKVKQFYDPVTYEELMGITRIWVDAAFQLSDKDIRVMQRLVKAQNRSIDPHDGEGKNHVLRTKQNRRFAQHNVSFPLLDSSGQTIPLDRRKTERRNGDHWQFADKAQDIDDLKARKGQHIGDSI